MRLSEWADEAPSAGVAGPRVLNVVVPVLAALGADETTDVWVIWGEEPQARWSVLAPTLAGLAMVHVRVNAAQEGPRASGKLTRWPRVQVGDLAVEMQGAHRMVATTVEGQVMRGIDDAADRIARFIAVIYAAIDGRDSRSTA